MKNLKMNTSKTKNNLNTQELKGLNSWQITGIFDGEGSWGLSIIPNSKRSLGFIVGISMEIGLHKKDLAILQGLQAYFGVGGIYKHAGDMMRYKVSSIKDFNKVIIPHFDKYPLITQKRVDYELLKCVVSILSKGPLSPKDLQEIVNLKASLNRGLSLKLQALFPNTVKVEKPINSFNGPLHPSWVLGFTEAEGSFIIGIYKKPSCKIGKAALLRFVLTQHSRDEKLLQALIEFFGCGRYLMRKDKEAGDFIVSKFEDLQDKIIPFFLKNSLLGTKSLSFKEFCKGGKLMKEKRHLTEEGLKELQIIQARVNNKELFNM